MTGTQSSEISISRVQLGDDILVIGERLGFPTIAARVRGEVGSACYNCWKRYFDCLFNGGTNCTDIGKTCDSVCQKERTPTQILVATSMSALARRMKTAQKANTDKKH